MGAWLVGEKPSSNNWKSIPYLHKSSGPEIIMIATQENMYKWALKVKQTAKQ